jgi:hypothetical protein
VVQSNTVIYQPSSAVRKGCRAFSST